MRWTFRDLGSLGGATSEAVALNARGQIVGRSDMKPVGSPRWHAFLWVNGKLCDLGVLWRDLGGDLPSLSTSVAITDAGLILGNGSVNQNVPVSNAFVWRNGKLTALTGPEDNSVGTAINERGQVVGWNGDEVGFRTGTAFLWQNGKLKDIGALRGRPYSWPHDVNASGQVVGESFGVNVATGGEQVRTHAFLWQNGKMTDLGLLPGTSQCSAVAVSAGGQIIGTCWTASLASTGFVWQAGRMTAIPGTPKAINNRGQVVGVNEDRAFIWQKGKTTDLGTSPGNGLTSVGLAINERGLVVGTSGRRAFAWQSGTLTDLGPGAAVAVSERGQIAGSRNGRAALWTPVG